jgi:hypothetical protein
VEAGLETAPEPQPTRPTKRTRRTSTVTQ